MIIREKVVCDALIMYIGLVWLLVCILFKPLSINTNAPADARDELQPIQSL